MLHGVAGMHWVCGCVNGHAVCCSSRYASICFKVRAQSNTCAAVHNKPFRQISFTSTTKHCHIPNSAFARVVHTTSMSLGVALIVCCTCAPHLQESGNWQVLLRALAALEAVLLRGSSQACGEIAVMFQSDPAPIRSALESPQAIVRERAAAVIKLLLGEEVAVAPAQGSGRKGTPRAAAAPVVADLLGDEEPVAGSSAAAGGAAGIDLLGGLDDLPPAVAAAAPAAAVAGAVARGSDALFSGLEVPAAAAPQTSDMFGGLDVGAGLSSQAPAAAPAVAVPGGAATGMASRNVPLDDLFSGLGTSDNVSAAGSPQLQAQQQQQQQHMQQQPHMQQQQRHGALPGTAGLASANGGPWLGPQQHMQQHPQQPMHSQPDSMAPPSSDPFSSVMPQQAAAAGMGYGMPPVQQQLVAGYGGMHGAPSNGSHPGLVQQQQAPGGMPYGGAPQHVQQQHVQQQQQGYGGMLLPGQQQAQPSWGGAPLAASGGSGNAKAWTGRDDVSNLMRHVASGGKHDPAFDFVSAEFSKRKG